MAVAVIGSALRARHPRDVYLDPREFSGVVVVLGIWNITETADNASAVHRPKVRDGLGRCDSRTTGAPGAATVDPFRWPLCSVPAGVPGSRCSRCVDRRSARRSAPLTMSHSGWGRAEISNWAVRCWRRSPLGGRCWCRCAATSKPRWPMSAMQSRSRTKSTTQRAREPCCRPAARRLSG